MARIDGQLLLKFFECGVILVEFPVQVPEAKMHVGLARGYARGRLKLDYRIRGLPQAVQGLPNQHMRCRRVWILLQNLAKLIRGAGVLLGKKTALRQHLTQFCVGRVELGDWLQVL